MNGGSAQGAGAGQADAAPRGLDRHHQLRPCILHVADGLPDWPDFQCFVWARLQQREQFVVARRLLPQPPRPIALVENDGPPWAPYNDAGLAASFLRRGDRYRVSVELAGALCLLWPHFRPGIGRLRLVRDFPQCGFMRGVQRALFFTGVFGVVFRFEIVRVKGCAGDV